MKIGINATCFNKRPSGAKQRFLGIYYPLIKRMNDTSFVIYQASDYNLSQYFTDLTNVTFRKTPIPSSGRLVKFLRGKIYWKNALKKENFDLFEGFNLPIVKAPTGKTIITVHDIRDISISKKSFKSIFYKLVMTSSLKSADHIITVSKSMKEEIRKYFPNLDVSVIYNGINPENFKEKSTTELLQLKRKLKLPDSFILSVGHIEKRKNYLNLIDAISYLKNNNKIYYLVIVGNDNNYRRNVDEYIKTKNLDDYISVYSGLSDDEISGIYQLCKLFIFPSYYEGFGIPILEAMASNTIISLSNIPVFREITHNKLNYFNPNNSIDIANNIIQSLTINKEEQDFLNYRKEIIKEFDFAKISKKMEYLYRSLA